MFFAGRLVPGLASKMAGFLSFLGQHAFRRVGRAMVRPIFAQAKQRAGKIGTELCLALRWWQEALACEINECWPWEAPAEPPAQIFADARSSPPRLAAVLIDKGKIYWCDMAPPEELVRQFKQRSDGQIMMLELLSLALGNVCMSCAACMECASLTRPVSI